MKQRIFQDLTTKCFGCKRELLLEAGRELDLSIATVCGLCWWEGKDTITFEQKLILEKLAMEKEK